MILEKNLLFSDSFFKENPSKVLGEAYDTTDRFGKPDVKIKGTIDNLDAIETGSFTPVLPAVETPVTVEASASTDAGKMENVKKAIERTERELGKKAVKELYKIDATQESDVYTFDEALEILNPGISKEEIQVWIWYCSANGINLGEGWKKYAPELSNAWYAEMVKKGYLCIDIEGNYIPSILYYSGNIYEKQGVFLNRKSEYIERFGEEQWDRQYKILSDVLPKPLSVGDPNENMRLRIAPISIFAKTQTFTNKYEDTDTLHNLFKKYLDSLSEDDFKENISGYEIRRYYLDKENFRRGESPERKIEIKKNSRIEGDRLFMRFLYEEFTTQEQKVIDRVWNGKYNAIKEVDYNKIPLGFTFSKKFKKGALNIRPAQREGVSYHISNGTSLIAYDVGVGKTLTAILTIAEGLYNNRFKRAVIVVPKSIYKKWVGEIKGVYEKDGTLLGSGVLPQYPLIELGNLNEDELAKLYEGKEFKQIPEKSITIITYEGLKNIGFEGNYENKAVARLMEILSQTDKGTGGVRDRELLTQQTFEIIGKGLENTTINIEQLGFDYMCIDEAHNMKNIFTSVKGELMGNGEREKTDYEIRGSESSRGIKSFLLSQYIQMINPDSNVQLLTATPFTNSPLEVFSMLALTNYNKLKKYGVNNIIEFFNNFVSVSYEAVYTADRKMQEKPIIKSFNNKIVLQRLVFSYINYKSGEDAGIQRPKKYVLPMFNELINGEIRPLPKEQQISTYLQPTKEQKKIFQDIEDWLAEGYDKDDKGKFLVAISRNKQATFSPYLHDKTIPKSAADFIKSSPKLDYTMQCIKSIRDHHEKTNTPISGIVIYSAEGVDYFPFIKEYLINELGYKKGVVKNGKTNFDEVEILGGSSLTDIKKEQVKDLFLAGEIKVIIGTDTIKEGVDLQNRSTNLFNLWLDWNPTDIKQLEGRIWRFDNIYGAVRITAPLLEDSSDPFVFQKLEEKTSRINDIFDRGGENILKIEEIDPEEIKIGLITNTKELARIKIQDDQNRLKLKLKAAESRLSEVDSASVYLERVERYFDEVKDLAKSYKEEVDRKAKFDIHNPSEIVSYARKYMKYVKQRETGNSYYSRWMSIETTIDQYIKTVKMVNKVNEILKNNYKTDIRADITPVLEKIQAEIDELNEKMSEIGSESNYERLVKYYDDRRKAINANSRGIAERVEEFKKLNYLLDIPMKYDFVPEKQTGHNPKIEEKVSVLTKADYQAAIDGLEILLEDAKGKHKKDVSAAIEGLKVMIELI